MILNVMAGTTASTHRRRLAFRAMAAIGVTLAVVVLLSWIELSTVQTDYFRDRSGNAEQATIRREPMSDRMNEWVSLLSSSGLRVEFRTVRPLPEGVSRLPVVLVIGGQETGKDAVDLVRDLDGIAYAAIDYPYSGSKNIHGVWQSLRALPAVQGAFLDTPPALMLACRWLQQQSWVDPARIELVGVSLGVPFAAAAGALEPRFARVWLIHGVADNRSWIEFALRRHVTQDWLREGTANLAHLLVYGNSFDTARWVRATSPRPVILISARDDERVPASAVPELQALSENAHVELLWTDGQHIEPGRIDVLQQLLSTVSRRVRDADRGQP